MRSLDELLRDASAAWLHEARPTMVQTADQIAGTRRPGRWMWWSVGGTTAVVLIGAAWWSLSLSPDTRSAAVRTAAPMQRPQPAVATQPAPRLDRTNHQRPATTRSIAEETHRTTPAHPAAVDADATLLTSERAVDGFSVEYERVLARAMQFERSDPLRAATEYLGLGKLCINSKQWAHAVSALQRSEELARRGQFQQLMPQVQQYLEVAQRGLRP